MKDSHPAIESSRVGLCATCVHCKLVRSDRGSVFYRCSLSEHDSHFPKCPRLPVLECSGWKERDGDPDQPGVRVGL
jgi:hypothetical protein